MTELPVRRLLINLETPFAQHWMGGDAFRTALFNALSMSFPIGEQFFIDSVRKGLRALPTADLLRFEQEAQGFIGQEATHRRIHALFNAHLERQGLVNHWEPRVRRRLRKVEQLETRHWLAITAATEHFTAVLADWVLSHPEIFGDTEERLQTLWLWHSAEESEHKCTAFDLYRALNGSERWRRVWFRRISIFFFSDLLRQTVHNLHRDGTLWRQSTWASGLSFLFGRGGFVRSLYAPLRAYNRTGFHPSQSESRLGASWLDAHRRAYSVVPRPASSH